MANTFSGARSVFFVENDQGLNAIGYAAGVSGEELLNMEPVETLGLLEVREHVEVGYTCSLSAQIFRVVGESIKQQGIMPRQENMLVNGEMSCMIKDAGVSQLGNNTQLGNTTVQLFQGVKCSGHSFDISARGVVQENVTFVAIRTIDELETVL